MTTARIAQAWRRSWEKNCKANDPKVWHTPLTPLPLTLGGFMNTGDTALILIGFQNDYFAHDGILKGFIDESAQETQVLARAPY